MPAGDATAPASALSGANGTSSFSEVRLEFEVEAPVLPPKKTPPPSSLPSPGNKGGKKTRARNSTDESGSETENKTDDDDGSDGSPRYAPALGAALACFADLPRDRVTIGLSNRRSNGNITGKCGARSQSKKSKKARKQGACSSFEATMRLNDGEEADNVRQACASGDVSGFVESLRRATTTPGLPAAAASNNNSSVASVESISSKASASSASSPVLVEPTPYNVIFTAIDGTPLSAATAGREVVTDGSEGEKQPLGGGAIAGIVVGALMGAVAAFALSLAAVAAVRRRREKRAFAAKRAGGGGVGA